MDLVIKPKHVRGSTRESASKCPTVRALRDVGFKSVSVPYIDELIIDQHTKNSKCVTLPNTLVKAIVAFDEGGKFKAGTYRIAGLKKPKVSKS